MGTNLRQDAFPTATTDGTRALRQRLRALGPQEVPDGVLARLHARIEQEKQHAQPARRSRAKRTARKPDSTAVHIQNAAQQGQITCTLAGQHSLLINHREILQAHQAGKEGKLVAGRYRLLAAIGRGSAGDVYQASDIAGFGIVAVKMAHGQQPDKEKALYAHEFAMLSRLQHPHILRALDYDLDDGVPYLVTDYAPRGTIRDLLHQQEGIFLPISQVLQIVTQVGAALQYLHTHHVIHRDVKPENLLITGDQQILLADFGLAIRRHAGAAPTTATLDKDAEEEVTVAAAGTPAYMAPEQFRGKPQQASDQYALGCVAYELFTGQRPVNGDHLHAYLEQHLFGKPRPLDAWNPQLPAALNQVVFTALAKQPADRYPSVQAFLDALHAALASGEARCYPNAFLYTRSFIKERVRAIEIFLEHYFASSQAARKQKDLI